MQDRSHSLKALNWLSFSLADVSTGVGPFLAVFLAGNRHWDASKIGIAISAMSFATVIAQSPAGLLVDKTVYKRYGVIAASVLIAVSSILILLYNNIYIVIGAQIIIGVSSAFFIPVLIALALGIGCEENFDKTISINQTYNHAGNVVSAVIIGVLGHYTHNEGIFYALTAFCILSVISALSIHEKDIDHFAASSDTDKDLRPSGPSILVNKNFLVLLFVSVLFHFANAAMLPLVGQELGKTNQSNASLYMAACIIIAQLVMVPVSFYSSRWVSKGRKPLLMIGFILLPVRGVLYTLWNDPVYLTSIQILDGIAAGIFGVVSILMVSDLFKNSGKVNFTQGIMAAAIGLGATLSNLLTGFLVKAQGFTVGFLSLASLAAVAFIVLWLAVPETLHIQSKNRINDHART